MERFNFSKQLPGLVLSKRKTFSLKALCFVLVAGLGLIPIYKASTADADWAPTVQIISPTTSTVARGTLSVSFKVDGLPADAYEPFWAVGDGTWNRMDQSKGISSTDIDTTGWNWNADNTYVLSFIALQKESWQPIIQKRVITLDQATAPQTSVAATFSTISQVKVASAMATETPADTGKTLYVDPESDTQKKAKDWIADNPEDSSTLNKLITQPLANWYGGWNTDVRGDVDRYVSQATATSQMPVLVAYNIPNRDCGSYSAGGVANRQAYASWTSEFAQGIGNRDAIVLLEPDALAALDCLSKSAQADRIDMIRESVATLKSLTHAKVYIDAGHPEWQSASIMATRLKQAGIADADGFSLNVSNFTSTDKNIEYGKELSRKTNNAHFVIDTSRNGSGSTPDLEWCNPSDVKAGIAPTLSTGKELVDAYLWVKAPGGSDGTCGDPQLGTTAPSAGEWWPQYALKILR